MSARIPLSFRVSAHCQGILLERLNSYSPSITGDISLAYSTNIYSYKCMLDVFYLSSYMIWIYIYHQKIYYVIFISWSKESLLIKWMIISMGKHDRLSVSKVTLTHNDGKIIILMMMKMKMLMLMIIMMIIMMMIIIIIITIMIMMMMVMMIIIIMMMIILIITIMTIMMMMMMMMMMKMMIMINNDNDKRAQQKRAYISLDILYGYDVPTDHYLLCVRNWNSGPAHPLHGRKVTLHVHCFAKSASLMPG